MSVTLSQIGIPASVTIVPGPGVGFATNGAPGVGYASATVGPDGHLHILRTDGATIDAGKVGRTCARVVPVGNSALTGTVLVDEVTIVLPNPQGGAVVLPGGVNLERKVINLTGAALLVWVGPLASIDGAQAGTAVQVAAGGSATYHSPDGLAWVSA